MKSIYMDLVMWYVIFQLIFVFLDWLVIDV